MTQNDLYILPQDLLNVRVEYYDGWGVSVFQEIDIEPSISLGAGDAITFTVDLDAFIANGTNPGVFNWEDIEWNELEEVTIP